MYIPNWLKRQKKSKEVFTPTLPLTWWIDDLTHSVCGLVEDPERGLSNMPWPDCDKVYLAVNKVAYDELLKELDWATDRMINNDVSRHRCDQLREKYNLK